eukprot:Em0005g1088a
MESPLRETLTTPGPHPRESKDYATTERGNTPQQQVLQEAHSSPLSVEPGVVDVLKSQETRTKPSSGTFTKPKQTPRQCTKCGKGPHPWYLCPAKDSVCHKCKRKGHFSSQCLSKTVAEVEPDESYVDTAFLDTLSQNSSETWRVKLRLCGQMLEFKIDTGAEVTAISDAAFRTLRGPKLKSPKKTLYGPARTPLKLIGQLEGELSHPGKTTKRACVCGERSKTNLLGLLAILALDLVAGFWQIPLTESSKLLMTFITPFGRYYFHKLPFGICSAPEHCQKRMSQILAGLKGVLCQMNDVLVFGSDKAEHDIRLAVALDRIRNGGVTLNREKCEFEKNELLFLGDVVDHQGIQADPASHPTPEEFPPNGKVFAQLSTSNATLARAAEQRIVHGNGAARCKKRPSGW